MKSQIKNLKIALAILTVVNLSLFVVGFIIVFQLDSSVNANLNHHIETTFNSNRDFENVIFELEASGILESSRFIHDKEDCQYFIEERCDESMSQEECKYELPRECTRFIEAE
ncbi:hypothetical protein FWD07_03120 [Candidatus Saccharibacteria bacterium]|nr:hypothetical protein [Candidatus Saccharibacteria bacterium]